MMQRSQFLAVVAVALLVFVPGVALGTVDDHDSTSEFSAAESGVTQQQDNVTGSPSLSASIANNRVQPGEERTLQVTLINDGNVTDGSLSNPALEERVTTARALTAELNVSDVETEPRIDPRTLEVVEPRSSEVPITVETNEQAVARLPDGASAPLAFDVTVDSDAGAGVYHLPLNVSYNYTSEVDPERSRYNTTTKNKTFNLTLVVEETPRFEVVDVDSNARVGATGTVEVTLENTGTQAARNTSVALTSENSDLTFGEATTGSRYVGGAWEPGERRNVSYRVRAARSASQQQYAFTAQATYENEEGNARQSRALSLGVTPDPEQTFSVVETESTVAVANEGSLLVTIRNDGPIDVDDASVTLQSASSDIVFGESATAEQFVGTWETGETHTVAVNATALPGASERDYSVSATVSYEDREDDPEESRPLQFGLRPGPEPEFTANDVSSNLRVGEDGTLSGTITNTGGSEAENVVVVFETQTETITPLESEYAVGTLAPGESETFEFDVEVSGSAKSGPRQFTLRPQYRADDQQRQGDSFDVREQVEPERDVFELSVADASVEQGATSEIVVEVTNAGDETLSDVSAALFADDPIDVDDGDGFIQELEPGDSETIVFEISSSGSALTKRYPVELDFQYDEPDGDTKLSSGYKVGVQVTEPEDSGPPVLLIVALVALLAVAGAGAYLRFGR